MEFSRIDDQQFPVPNCFALPLNKVFNSTLQTKRDVVLGVCVRQAIKLIGTKPKMVQSECEVRSSPKSTCHVSLAKTEYEVL